MIVGCARGVMQHPHQRVDVTVEAELGCDRTRAVAQASVRFWILEARDDGVGKPARCRRVAGRKVAVDPGTKPVGNAANGKRRSRNRCRPASGPTNPNGSGHRLGTTSRSAARVERIYLFGLVEPSREDTMRSAGSRDAMWPRPPATRRSRGSVPDKRDVERVD